MNDEKSSPGVIARISGPVVNAKNLPDARLHDGGICGSCRSDW